MSWYQPPSHITSRVMSGRGTVREPSTSRTPTLSIRDAAQARRTGRQGTRSRHERPAVASCVGSLTVAGIGTDIGTKGYAAGARRVGPDRGRGGAALVGRSG